jgi:hypothetical protein
MFVHFYDIEPKKIDKVIDFCVTPHHIILLISIPFWCVWGTTTYHPQLFFSLSMSSSIFSILQTNSYCIKYIYGKPDTFDSLYVKKKITERIDMYVIEKRFQKLFIIIAIVVITFSTFGFIYFQLFNFNKTTTPAQIFVMLFSALLSIDSIQRVICSYSLYMLIKHQRYLIKKNNLIKFNQPVNFRDTHKLRCSSY